MVQFYSILGPSFLQEEVYYQYATWQAVSLFPQRLETAAPSVAGNRSFCLVGQRAKPFEQLHGRGWLRVREPNAVVPAEQEQARPTPFGESEKRQTRSLPPLSNGGQPGKGLSG